MKQHQATARLNIVTIHGGTEGAIEIEGHLVGVGIDINRYRKFCEAGRHPPDIIAEAIAYLPTVTELEPPISLARWEADSDGWSVYEQCVGLAYKNQGASISVHVKTMPSPTSSGDVVRVEKGRADAQKQLEQIQREASP